MSDDRIAEILSLPEGPRLEFKRVGNNARKLETVVALANTSGGLLVLGVEDPQRAHGGDRLYGVEENPESVDDLRRQIAQRITPPLALPDSDPPRVVYWPCTLRSGQPGHLAIIRVAKSSTIHSLVDGGTYARFDRSNRQLSAAEITRLSLQRGKTSVVDQPVDLDLALLDTVSWQRYARARQLTRALPEALRHLGLAVADDAGRLRPTRAAVLLFAEQPGGLLRSKCAVRVFHYRGDRVVHTAAPNLVRPPQTVSGALSEQIRLAIELIKSELSTGVQVGPLGFEIVQSYPLRVLREAITNAVIHRDYGISADIQVRIFDTRIEIENPGSLPGRVTIGNIDTVGSQPRNVSLVDHLREFPEPPNLDAGEGVRMMFSVMAQAGLFQPAFTTDATLAREAVQVVLRNQARPSIWDQVVDYLKQHPTIGNQEIRQILRTDDPTKASKQLMAWVEDGILVVANPEVGKRSRRYRLAGALPEPELFAFDDGRQSKK